MGQLNSIPPRASVMVNRGSLARFSQRRAFWGLFGLFAVIGIATAYWWPRPKPVPVAIHDDDIEEPETYPNPGYVGIEACAKCHAERVADFQKTKHFHACRLAEPDAMGPGFVAGKNTFALRDPPVRFEMKQVGNDFIQTVIHTTPQGENRTDARIALVYGSTGTGDEIYFTWHGDRLYELPAAWLFPQNSWAASPFNPYQGGDFTRTTTTRCLECHNTWLPHVRGSENQYNPDHWILTIQCEKYHR